MMSPSPLHLPRGPSLHFLPHLQDGSKHTSFFPLYDGATLSPPLPPAMGSKATFSAQFQEGTRHTHGLPMEGLSAQLLSRSRKGSKSTPHLQLHKGGKPKPPPYLQNRSTTFLPSNSNKGPSPRFPSRSSRR